MLYYYYPRSRHAPAVRCARRIAEGHPLHVAGPIEHTIVYGIGPSYSTHRGSDVGGRPPGGVYGGEGAPKGAPRRALACHGTPKSASWRAVARPKGAPGRATVRPGAHCDLITIAVTIGVTIRVMIHPDTDGDTNSDTDIHLFVLGAFADLGASWRVQGPKCAPWRTHGHTLARLGAPRGPPVGMSLAMSLAVSRYNYDIASDIAADIAHRLALVRPWGASRGR